MIGSRWLAGENLSAGAPAPITISTRPQNAPRSKPIPSRLVECRLDRPTECGFQCVDTQLTAIDAKSPQAPSLSAWRS